MSIKDVNPYLAFDGTARQAIKLYESALGAKTDPIMRFGDVKEMNLPKEHADRVMHAMLRIGSAAFMLSDTMPGTPAPAPGNVQVCLAFDSVDDMRKKFDALAAGGKVTMPLNDTFWGATFGMLTDAFGIQWMFNCPNKAS